MLIVLADAVVTPSSFMIRAPAISPFVTLRNTLWSSLNVLTAIDLSVIMMPKTLPMNMDELTQAWALSGHSWIRNTLVCLLLARGPRQQILLVHQLQMVAMFSLHYDPDVPGT